MPLACCTLILIMVVYCEFAVANLFFKSPCEANKAYSQNLFGITKSRSRIQCGLLCKTNDACNSFTYNRRSGLCQLSTGMEKNCNLLTNEADSQYSTLYMTNNMTLKRQRPFFVLHEFISRPYIDSHISFMIKWHRFRGCSGPFPNPWNMSQPEKANILL